MLIRLTICGLAAALSLVPAASADAQGLAFEGAPTPAISPAPLMPERAAAATVRCYQHGAKVMEDELAPEMALATDPPAGALQLRRPDGQRLMVLAVGDGLCVLRLQSAAAPPSPTAATPGGGRVGRPGQQDRVLKD